MRGKGPEIGRGDLVLLIAMALAAANVAWQLGASSFYIDEALSMRHALLPLDAIGPSVRKSEITPPTYYLGLHSWLFRVDSTSETAARVPSAVAAVLLVPATFWVGLLLAGRRVAHLAALLVAVSPLVLLYGQQARVYALLMLVTTLAVGTAITTTRQAGRARTVWLTTAALLALGAVWLHYPAAFVTVPLWIWLARRLEPGRARTVAVGAVGAGSALLLPLLLGQRAAGVTDGSNGIPGLEVASIVRVLQGPFDGRSGEGTDLWRLVGVAVVLTAATLVARREDMRAALTSPRLTLGLAAAAPAAVLALGATGSHVVLSRYVTPSAPLILVLVATAVVAAPRRTGVALLAGALVASGVGLGRAHRPAGYSADARGAIALVQERREPRDAVVVAGGVTLEPVLAYYAEQRLRPLPPYVAATAARSLTDGPRRPARLWLVVPLPPGDGSASDAQARRATDALLGGLGYRAAAVDVLVGAVPIAVVLGRDAR